MFLVELTPAALVYLSKLMDAPNVSVKAEDVMTHAQIRQQLGQPTEAAKIMEQWKAQGAQEAAQNAIPTPNLPTQAVPVNMPPMAVPPMNP